MPTITGVSPQAFGDGRSVTVTGSGFGASGTVTIGGVTQNIVSWSDDTVVFTAVRGTQSMGPAVLDVVGGSGTTAFFTDGLETGDKTHTEGGVTWSVSDVNVDIVASRGNPSYGMQFEFAGNADPNGEAWAEQRFDLGQIYSELTVEFDLYIPDGTEGWSAAYAHRNNSPTNNKVLRLWPADYADQEKIGLSFWYDSTGISKSAPDWNTGSGMGPKPAGVYFSYITASDLGSWVTFKYYAKAATATTQGTIKVWKNGTLVHDNVETVDNYDPTGGHGWRYGYLMGYANSGFASTTRLIIDNVKFYSGAA